MSGMFHALKKTVNKGEAQPDAEFTAARTRFDQYAAALVTLKGNLQSYLTSASSLFLNANSVAQTFTTLIDDPDCQTPNPWRDMTTSVRQEHATLAADQVPAQTAAQAGDLIAHIDAEIARNGDLQKRCVKRMELFGELGYYTRKVSELRADRDAKLAKGKVESASDKEKFDRNQQKLNEIQVAYTDANTKLMTDLQKLWNEERVNFAGPLMHTWVAQEKAICQAFVTTLNAIKDDGAGQGASGSSSSSS